MSNSAFGGESIHHSCCHNKWSQPVNVSELSIAMYTMGVVIEAEWGFCKPADIKTFLHFTGKNYIMWCNCFDYEVLNRIGPDYKFVKTWKKTAKTNSLIKSL